MRVFFLKLFKKLHLSEYIARVGLPEDLGELDGGEPVAWVLAVFIRYLGNGELGKLRASARRGWSTSRFLGAFLFTHRFASSMRRCAFS
ncbi:hypothetical protein SDC9_96297 [bioreactor metagenome]|uniref:Uncharacterized protein n=1 Tax=bioreactor metagenome TaxID=1076179 RepID=A0A645A932_9ZZZZ